MMFDTLRKKVVAYFATFPIAFQNDAASPPAGVKLMNVTGLTNSSLVRNGTAFNATEISNFTISNFTMASGTTTYASTVILPESLFPLFNSATGASELQSALSTVTIEVSTSAILDSHRISASFSSASPTSHVAVVHQTPTGSTATASIGSNSSPISTSLHSSTASLGLSTTSSTPIKISAAKSTPSSSKTTEVSSNSLRKSSTPADNVSGTAIPAPAIVQSNPSSTGHGKVLTATQNNYTEASRISDIPNPSPSILSLATSTPIRVLNHTSNSSLAVSGGARNSYGNAKSLERMLGAVLKPSDCKGLMCKEIASPIPVPLTSNYTSTRVLNSTSTGFSNSSDISSTDVDDLTVAMENEMLRDVGTQLCADVVEMELTPLCENLKDPDWNFNIDTETTTNGPPANFTTTFNYAKYFEDLNDLEQFPDNRDIPDEVYFEINDENLRDSQAVRWYNAWTVIAQRRPEWKVHGEWGLFWRDYLKEPNFRCPNGFASCNYQVPTLAEILRMFPENRPLGRRVLFTMFMYGVMHDYSNQLDIRFKDTHAHFDTLIPDIVKAFTLQTNDDKKRVCDIYKSIVQTAINIIIDLSIAILTDGIGMTLTTELNKIVDNVFQKVMNKFQARRFEVAFRTAEKDLAHVNWSGDFDIITIELKTLTKTRTESVKKLEKQIEERIQTLREITTPPQDLIKKITTKDPELGHLSWKLQAAKSRLVDANLLQDTFKKDNRLDSNLKIEKLKGAVQRLVDCRAAGKPWSKDSRKTMEGAEYLHSEKADQWGKSMITNMINQLAWNPITHIPQGWMINYYHGGYSWGVDGANDGPDWHNSLKEGAGEQSLSGTSVLGNAPKGGIVWQNPLINEAYRAWPRNKLMESPELAKSGLRGGFTELPSIIGGSGKGWMCSDFEGDWKDLNTENTELLRQRVTAELDSGRRQVWTLYKDMYDGAVPEPGQPSMVARWMLARKWIGKNEEGTVEYDLNNMDAFRRKFELEYVKDLASSTLSSGYNYMKCSHREDAAEKCAKIGQEYESLFCPTPDTDPTLVCQTARWYFSSSEPHEIDMVATGSLGAFGALHGFKFNKKDMLQEIWNNYKKFGNNWHAQDWGIKSMEYGNHPRGFYLSVCMYEDNEMDVHEHQRLWWKNINFPAACGNHAANETANFMGALSLGPDSSKHRATDWTFADRIPRVLMKKSPYTVYMSYCEMGLRWPNKKYDDTNFWNRYTLKASQDTEETNRNCRKQGWPDCPEKYEKRHHGDRDCPLVKEATLKMDEMEANTAFCLNSMGHTIFKRDAPHIWAGLVPLTILYNNEYHCVEWLERNGVKAMEAVSHRTLDAAEKGLLEQPPPPMSGFRDADILSYLGNSTSWGETPKANVTAEEEHHAGVVLDGAMNCNSTSSESAAAREGGL